jgi:type IV pilus assembly protein PilE
LTLIELMIAVVVIAILASIAFPSYERYLQRSRRSDAQQFVASLDTRQKQVLIDQRGYAAAPNALNVAAQGWSCDASRCTSQQYTVTFDPPVDNGANPPSYAVCAVPIAGSAQVADGTLRLDSTGAKLRFTAGTCAAPGADLRW